ncbi:quaternary ammonium transporter [Acinetobacter qingfengensis]|uniref:Quaternary ammonium transporter n=1 Tax=Acinetobacter qingfengensis TaxID=1262585 RepID=A0A1E7RFE0_9GAMM|nr:SMR family transporter [Acinetobacter qingfengensis]KAA8731904.1 quaternary ammonium transporter [Acinetobacter qingfengensis]OEY97972.1 quaternary ammonium transporter [Acinetobacter qingfengensis]
MLDFSSKINPGIIWLMIAILTDVFSTFYSAKANGLENKYEQIFALLLYIISFACCAIALKYMQAGILYVLWSGIGVMAVALLSRIYLGQIIDIAGWIGITLITLGLIVIAKYSNINV